MPKVTDRRGAGIWILGLLAILSGAATGLIVGMFRLVLELVSRRRTDLISGAHHVGPAGAVAVIAACAAAAATAAWLVRRFSKYASGSGVPEVMATLSGHLPPAPLRRILLVKFAGGIISIGSGLAVGPEGPGVQMGAVGARLLGTVFRRNWQDIRAMIAAGAGAGIAVAFNAPIAGAVFVLEGLMRELEPRVAVAGLGASASAILVSRLILGDIVDLHVLVSQPAAVAAGSLPYASLATWPLYLMLGLFVGAVALLYNKALIQSLSITEGLKRIPIEVKAAVIGAVVGTVGWFAPDLLGTGETIMQNVLGGHAAVAWLVAAFLVRFPLGAISYAAKTPGGLFAPLLTLGALCGYLFGMICNAIFPGASIDPIAFAAVGMSAFFTGVVRAPVTAIVLTIETTAAFSTLLPMLVASFAVMLVTTWTGQPPIYASLVRRLTDRLAANASAAADRESSSLVPEEQ